MKLRPQSLSLSLSQVLFFAVAYAIVGNAQGIPQLLERHALFARERAAGASSAPVHLGASAAAAAPMLALAFALFLAIACPAIGLPARLYAPFCGVLLATHLVGYALAVAVAAGARSQQVALAIFPVLFLLTSMFAGFAVQVGDPRARARESAFPERARPPFLASGTRPRALARALSRADARRLRGAQLPTLAPFWRCWAPYASFPRWAYQALFVRFFAARAGGADLVKQFGCETSASRPPLPRLASRRARARLERGSTRHF